MTHPHRGLGNLPIALLALGSIVVAACSSTASDTGDDSAAVSNTPETGARDQKDTGNCWLYATAGWIESLEYAAMIQKGQARADDPATRPFHISVSYWDYWDWYTKITSGKIKGRDADALNDALDSGGSWGAAVEIAKRYGFARSRGLVGTTDDEVHQEASKTLAALKTLVESLSSGDLKTVAARKDASLVRKELDRAFAFSPGASDAFTRAFGDGSRTFDDGSATPNEIVKAPADLQVLIPRRDAASKLVTLRDVIGDRARRSDPDGRVGEFAWSVVPYDATTPAETRDYFRRIQRALNDGVPLPISWYVASNGDDGHEGVYQSIPASPADAADSSGHETLLDDYEVDGVPGFGRLPAGTPASPEAKRASLDESARVVFLRVKNSWGRKVNATGPAGYNDLYFEYLTGTVHVCPEGASPNSRKCTDEVPLEDVTLPAGY